MNKVRKAPLVLTLSSTLLAGMNAVSYADSSVENVTPFSMTELSSGYMQLAEAEGEMKASEGKCGANGAMPTEESKAGEGKCGAKESSEKSTDAVKAKEGKCGEGKCGGAKDAKPVDATKTMEGKCGAGKTDSTDSMTKTQEGKCGNKATQ